jgi:hypothetical protein
LYIDESSATALSAIFITCRNYGRESKITFVATPENCGFRAYAWTYPGAEIKLRGWVRVKIIVIEKVESELAEEDEGAVLERCLKPTLLPLRTKT